MYNKNNLQKRILEKIKRDNIKPKSRIFFRLKNLSFWTLSLFFIIFGAISFASILYKVSGNFDFIKSIFENKFSISENIFYVVPFLWVLFLIIFLYLAILNYKKTKLFYRWSINFVILSAITLSFILGSIMFTAGLAQKTEEISQKYLPFYDKYLKIQDIKKKIFLEKMQEIGITKEILENNPELKKKVLEKFDKNVLGKIYLYRTPNQCLKQNFKCQLDEVFFEDKKGCGCREVHSNLKDE